MVRLSLTWHGVWHAATATYITIYKEITQKNRFQIWFDRLLLQYNTCHCTFRIDNGDLVAIWPKWCVFSDI